VYLAVKIFDESTNEVDAWCVWPDLCCCLPAQVAALTLEAPASTHGGRPEYEAEASYLFPRFYYIIIIISLLLLLLYYYYYYYYIIIIIISIILLSVLLLSYFLLSIIIVTTINHGPS
jgi:hypothetical protein